MNDTYPIPIKYNDDESIVIVLRVNDSMDANVMERMTPVMDWMLKRYNKTEASFTAGKISDDFIHNTFRLRIKLY